MGGITEKTAALEAELRELSGILRKCDHGTNQGLPGVCPEDRPAARPSKLPRRGASDKPDAAAPSSAFAHIHQAAAKKASELLRFVKQIPAKIYTAARQKVVAHYQKLAGRYGRRTAQLILAAGLAGSVTPLPGGGLIAAAPLIGAAELYRRLAGQEKAFSPVVRAWVKAEGESFFANCDRDEQGHCKPGTGGSGSSEAKPESSGKESGKRTPPASDPVHGYIEAFNDTTQGKATAKEAREANRELRSEGSKWRVVPDGKGGWQAAHAAELADNYGSKWTVAENPLTGEPDIGEPDWFEQARGLSGDKDARGYVQAFNDRNAETPPTAEDAETANNELAADGSPYRIQFSDELNLWVAVKAGEKAMLPAHIKSRRIPSIRKEGRWVTIGAHASDDDSGKHGGTHVYIDSDGTISRGPSGLVGKKPSELGRRVTAEHGANHPETGTPEGPKEKPKKKPEEKPAEKPQESSPTAADDPDKPEYWQEAAKERREAADAKRREVDQLTEDGDLDGAEYARSEAEQLELFVTEAENMAEVLGGSALPPREKPEAAGSAEPQAVSAANLRERAASEGRELPLADISRLNREIGELTQAAREVGQRNPQAAHDLHDRIDALKNERDGLAGVRPGELVSEHDMQQLTAPAKKPKRSKKPAAKPEKKPAETPAPSDPFTVGSTLHPKETLYRPVNVTRGGGNITEEFSKPGEPLEIVGMFANGAVEVRRPDGETMIAPPGMFAEWKPKLKPRKAAPRRTVKAWLPWLRVKSSFFSDCERDDAGHCKPGTGGGNGASASKPSERAESEERTAWKERSAARDHRRRMVESFDGTSGSGTV